MLNNVITKKNILNYTGETFEELNISDSYNIFEEMNLYKPRIDKVDATIDIKLVYP
jgi:hypothetical protein